MHFCIRMSHWDDATLHGANEDTFVYLIKDENAFVNTKDKNIYFHAPNFYKYKKIFQIVFVLDKNLKIVGTFSGICGF